MSMPLQISGVDAAALPAGALHLAIGMFDGVHRGHRAVLEPAVAAARAAGAVAGVLTFWPHPSALFRPQSPTRLIQPPAVKAEVLGRLGVQVVMTESFTSEFAALPAEEFLPWLKRRLPSLVAVYVGDNFRFGHKRRGDRTQLETSGHALGIRVTCAPRFVTSGEPVSSTRIRAHLEAGEIEAANALLGYPYFSPGRVTAGKRLGRTIGFPTLNLPWSPQLRPKLGVYAVRVTGREGAGAALAGVANYGLRPTVEQALEPKLEVHVLGACPFDAGSEIEVEWLRFLRPEMKFSGVDELRAQIARDRDAASEWWQARPIFPLPPAARE